MKETIILLILMLATTLVFLVQEELTVDNLRQQLIECELNNE